MMCISIVFAFLQFDAVLAQVLLNPFDNSLSTRDIDHQFLTMPFISIGTLIPNFTPPIFMLFTAFGENNGMNSNISTVDLVIYDLCNDDIGVVRIITSTSENKPINVYAHTSSNYDIMATDASSSVDLSEYIEISKSSNSRTYGIYDMDIPPDTDSFFVILYNEDYSKHISHHVNVSSCKGYDVFIIQNDDDGNTFILPPSPYFTDISIKSFTESTSLETIVKEPETIVKEPETIVKEPETIVKEPETIVKEPETIVKEPETIVKEPETIVKEPETIVKEPETIVKEPETIVKEPETIVKEPETIVKEPETIVKEPETIVKEPETIVKEPETIVKEPETIVKEPETIVKEPETIVKEPETIVKEPETIVKEPETIVKEPETIVKEPETIVKEPETIVKEPETIVKEPETIVKEPETIVKEPETNQKQNSVAVYNGPKSLLDQYYLFSDSINEQKFDIVYLFEGNIYPVIEYENQISFYLGDFVSDSLLLHLPKPLFNENYDIVLKSNNGQKSFARYDVLEYGIDYSILDVKLSKDSIKLNLILNIQMDGSNQYIIINSSNNKDSDLTDSFIETLSKIFGF